MAEVPLDFLRTWLEIPLPSSEEDGAPTQVLRVDITWLTSSWTCIFGRGCAGIYADRPTDGCCTLGAHFTEDADIERVEKWVDGLTDDQWQRRQEARISGWVEKAEGDEGETEFSTRIVDGACIFLNDPGFPGGSGCALHHAALTAGREPLEAKPDVCWQLPLKRQYRNVERGDGSIYQEVTITEFDRRAWGAGGHDLDWYCTGNPQAHGAAEPVFRSLEAELRELIGDEGYNLVAAACEEAMAARRALPLTVITHPATAAQSQSQDLE